MTPQTKPLRSSVEARPSKLRSRVSNGKSLFVATDRRGPWARRFADVLGEIAADIADDHGLSEAQRQLVRRAATLCIACEKLEGEAAAGNDIDLDVYGKMVDRLGRTFQRLGLKRKHPVINGLGELWQADLQSNK